MSYLDDAEDGDWYDKKLRRMLIGGIGRKMKMYSGSVSDDDTEGFCRIEQFEGEVAKISVEKLLGLLSLVAWMKSRDISEVPIGVSKKEENIPSFLVLFLDEKKEFGYAIAPMIGE